MPHNPTELDQSKRGLQDDHDPGDLGQQAANKPRGVEVKPGQKSSPEDPKPKEQSAPIQNRELVCIPIADE